MSEQPKDYFYTWTNEQERTEALAKQGDVIEHYDAIHHSTPSRTRARYPNFENVDTNLSVKSPFDRSDYDYYRPNEQIPEEAKAKIALCDNIYKKVGLIRNVIDLMGDFACQGIRIIHPDPSIQKLYRAWWNKINGTDRSERFLNLLYRQANVIVKSSTGKLSKRQLRQLKKTVAAPDMKLATEPKVGKREIPLHYSYLNPNELDVIGGHLALLVGKYTYGLKLNSKVLKQIKNPKPEEKDLLALLPQNIIDAVQSGQRILPLDSDKVSPYFYKKDDWQLWADPMIYAIADDIKLIEKMKLADSVALDGAISQVRLWKLGSLEHHIIPGPAAVSKLANVLLANVGGGAIDLIWGPELELVQSNTEVYKFLGSEKYLPHLNNVYAGLGIPPTLTGSATSSGFTNNYISLKTLTERLKYGRSVLVSFWRKELRKIQKALGHTVPAKIEFDHMTLSDESAERALLIQLVDRGYLSVQTLHDRFGEDFDIERPRLNSEKKYRKDGTLPPYLGPFQSINDDLKKIALQSGSITPGQSGMELEERNEGEMTSQELQMQNTQQKSSEPKGVPQQGRPKNSKDSTKRKQKVVKPRKSVGFYNTLLWAQDALRDISTIVTPILLDVYGIKTMRQATDIQTAEAEQVKFGVLCNMTPFSEVVETTVADILMSTKLEVSTLAMALYKEMKTQFKESRKRLPTIAEQRQMQTSVYSILQDQYLMETN